MFTWIARCLMQINSCVNPFIYAAVLPEFKKAVRNIFNGNQFGTRSSKSSNLSGKETVALEQLRRAVVEERINVVNTDKTSRTIVIDHARARFSRNSYLE